MLILGMILIAMVIGAAAQFLLGRTGSGVDWGMAMIAGFAGSFVGGLLVSLIGGDGLRIRPSGIIGSIVGAVIITAIWQRSAAKKKAAAKAASKQQRPGGSNAKRKH